MGVRRLPGRESDWVGGMARGRMQKTRSMPHAPPSSHPLQDTRRSLEDERKANDRLIQQSDRDKLAVEGLEQR